MTEIATKPESDVEQLFGPLGVVMGLVLVYGGTTTSDVWMLLSGVFFFALGCVFLYFWHDIRKHPEKWKSVN